MLSIEKALEIYTDMLNDYKKIDLNYFKNELSKSDYEEFLELIEFVKLGKSVTLAEEFEKTFANLNEYKNEYYSKETLQASGFRSAEGTCDKEAIDKLNEIFKEVFGDDE